MSTRLGLVSVPTHCGRTAAVRCKASLSWAFALLALASGCNSPRSDGTPDEAGQPDSHADASPDTIVDAASEETAVDALPDGAQWIEGDCAHPRVELQCDHSWCLIPAGCFILGSPATEWGRGMYSEDQVQVTLTRSVRVLQHEVTQAEWTALGLSNPSGFELENGGRCLEPDCPVGGVSWFETLAFANLLSESRGLPPCYKLVDCTGELGKGLQCASAELTAPSLYACEGFRLPSEAEWEYSARAGTRTTFYSGDFATASSALEAGSCELDEEALLPIAWYCRNSGNRTHPVQGKQANGWGLYDMSGNAWEWIHDHFKGKGYGTGPLVDPEGTIEAQELRVIRGGDYHSWPTLLRSSAHLMQNWNQRAYGYGFRLVRSGTDAPAPLQ